VSKTEAIILKRLYSKTDLPQIVEDITYKLNIDSTVHINGLESSSKNFFSSFFSYKSKEKTLIITKDEKEAEKAQKEISYFTDAEVPYLPRKQPDAETPFSLENLFTEDFIKSMLPELIINSVVGIIVISSVLLVVF